MNIVEFLNSLPHTTCETTPYPDSLCQLESNYPLFTGLARNLNPTSILEVGVRFGWSAISFLYETPNVEYYVGIDCQYEEDSNRKARENIQYFKDKMGRTFEFEILDVNSQLIIDLSFLNDRTFDFIFIDGDHTEAGCYKDLCNFWKVLKIGGNMVVDDSSWSEPRKAIKRFITEIQEPNYNIDYSFRGDWVITRTK